LKLNSTKKQIREDCFALLLASFGVPLLLNALTGEGPSPKRQGKGMQNRPNNILMPYQPPVSRRSKK